MGESRIPVDLRNPGQVFACLGLMELAEILHGPARGGYAWHGVSTSAAFTLWSPAEDPVADVIGALSSATVEAWTLDGVEAARALAVKSVATTRVEAWAFPFPVPDSSATLPARLRLADGKVVPVEHWGDGRAVGRDNVKFWGGMGGYSGAELLRDALALVGAHPPAATDPFGSGVPQDSSFRFDWRQSYVPLDAGFSPNSQKATVRMIGYPLVEILAAIGLQHARPRRPGADKLLYRYAVAGVPLPTAFARAVLGACDLGFPMRRFRIALDWPGKEGQQRCIIDAREEFEP